MAISEQANRIREEARHIRMEALSAAEQHYAAEGPWYGTIYWLGVPSVVLSAIAGAAAFTELGKGIVAGVISIVVAVLTSLMTFIDPAKKATSHHQAAQDYQSLFHNAGSFCRVDSLNETADEKTLMQKLDAFRSLFNDLNKSSPPVDRRSIEKAKILIAKGKGKVLRAPNDLADVNGFADITKKPEA